MVKLKKKNYSYIVAPNTPAWCPGGLTAQNELVHSPFMTKSIALMTDPELIKLASQVYYETAVSLSKNNE